MILSPVVNWFKRTSLVAQIAIALVLGIAIALLAPGWAAQLSILGTLFISALKAVAPVLVFVLVIAAISHHKVGETTLIKPVLAL